MSILPAGHIIVNTFTPFNKSATYECLFIYFLFGERQQGGSAVSQISFSAEESVSPKKPISLPEMAKQRELSGSLESETNEMRLKKQLSIAKTREISGHNVIFSPPPEIPPPPPASISSVSLFHFYLYQ